MKLTPHFDSEEFRSKDGASTPRGHLRELQSLCEDYLEPLRAAYGPCTVNSGHRSAKHNRHVGGAPMSRHLAVPGRRGAAADVRCRRGQPADWYAFLDDLGAGGLGLYDGFVHVDNRGGRARW